MNIKKLQKYCMRYWIIILLSILIILLITYYFINKKNSEGFSVLDACNDSLTEYAYLGIAKDAPMKEYKDGNVTMTVNYWSQQALDGFNNQIKKKGLQCDASGNPVPPAISCVEYVPSDKPAGLIQVTSTNDEAMFYGQFGVWPYGSYTKNYIDVNKVDDKIKTMIGVDLNEYVPTRLGYMMSGQLSDDTQNDPNSEPLQIWGGKVNPPAPYDSNSVSGIECKIGRTFMTT